MNGLLPVVDLRDAGAAAHADTACRDVGFFYVVGHGVDDDLERRLEDEATRFFSQPDGEKAAIAMARGGTAWRGWFPVGGELTSGVPGPATGTGRLSFPFFFDPSWDAIVPVPEHSLPPAQRWDGADPSTFEGTYGDYLVAKVAKVFPALASSLPPAADR